jgi:hypothetical protein
LQPLSLYPLHEEAEFLQKFCKLPLHVGKATLGSVPSQENPLSELYRRSNPNTPVLKDIEFDTAFMMPVSGECLFFLRYPSNFRLARDFGQNFTISGESSHGKFTLHSEQLYVNAEGEGPNDLRWAIAKCVNRPAEIVYGDIRPIAKVTALINNFWYERGNHPKDTGVRTILRVQARDRQIDFTHRPDADQVKALLEIGAIGPASLIEFSFDASPSSSELELIEFAHNIAGLCGLVAQQQTGIPLLSFIDDDGRPIKRFIIDAFESPFRSGYILRHLELDRALPQLFNECFDKYCILQKSERWAPMSHVCKTILDPPFMEYKCSQLMAGLERLFRNALVDHGSLTDDQAVKMQLPALISAVKSSLSWNVPKHYTANDRIRLLRNAVAHGGPLPWPSDEVSRDLQKWSLFLMRRVLMHLGFTGAVRSPNIKNGFWSESPVDDFSEDHNSFGP